MRQAAQQIMKQAETDIAAQSVNSAFAAVAASLAAAAAWMASVYSRRKTIAYLRQLEDRMLADIGLRRSQIVAAVNGEIDRLR